MCAGELEARGGRSSHNAILRLPTEQGAYVPRLDRSSLLHTDWQGCISTNHSPHSQPPSTPKPTHQPLKISTLLDQREVIPIMSLIDNLTISVDGVDGVDWVEFILIKLQKTFSSESRRKKNYH